MGLFSKKPQQPIVHAPVERVVYVRAGEPSVTAHLDAYSSLFSPKRADDHTVQVAVSGDWTAIRLPDAVHPWQLHNLAYWMLDCDHHGGEPNADVIAVSAAGPGYPGYRLVRDDEVPDALCGWDDEGHGWTVGVPGNAIVRPEDVPVPRALTTPAGFHGWRAVTVRLEDPGVDMNPGNEPTVKSRTHLRENEDFLLYGGVVS